MNNTWRDRARPVIAAVLSDLQGERENVIRKALREAYPFGPRQYHPYKIWCDEIQVQLGTKKVKPKEVDPNQDGLFV